MMMKQLRVLRPCWLPQLLAPRLEPLQEQWTPPPWRS
jgi:hypothetical protein